MDLRVALLGVGLAAAAGCQDPLVVSQQRCVGGLSWTKMKVTPIDKIDLLLVVDNSPGMADKQAVLARGMPELLAALTAPNKNGSARIRDVHVGVITSSLGSFGTSTCGLGHGNDHGYLLPRLAGTCATPAHSVITWTYGGELPSAPACLVTAARDRGCEFESTWEAAYRFLADPAPYAKAEARCEWSVSGDACGNNKIVVEGLDTALLAQRRAFLRPDSLLAVLVLSDENDASLLPAGLNWLPWGYPDGRMLRGWAGCANVPDDFEPDTVADFTRLHTEYRCYSCFEDASDPACKVKWASDPLDSDVDARALRAFRQTQRFGFNFLWGRQRYVDAFTKQSVLGSDRKTGNNSVFAGGFRDPSMVQVAAIVGVPDVLVSNEDRSPKELTDLDWERLVGPVGKRDPHMIEAIAPRAGISPFGGDRSVDSVNGGDRHVPGGNDLQYACIGPRPAAKSADCLQPDAHLTNPICANDGTQTFMKAYPGLRHLRIVKELGASGLVGSICRDSYAPLLGRLATRIRDDLGVDCVRMSFNNGNQDDTGCRIFESLPDGFDAGRRCEELGRGLCTPGAAPCEDKPHSPSAAAAILGFPIQVQVDGSPTTQFTQATAEGANVYLNANDGHKHLLCQVRSLQGEALQACRTQDEPAVDGSCIATDPSLISASCARRGGGWLRLLGGASPPDGAEVFRLCSEGLCW